MKYVIKFVYILALTTVLLISPRIGGWVADLFNYTTIDPDGAFMWISIHHIVQALVVLVLIVVITKFSKIKYHLGFGDKEEGMKHVKRFIMVFTGYTVIAFAITVLTNSFEPFAYPLTATNITGHMGFQLLLSGPSEEFIFRAFAISTFVFFISDKRLNKNFSYAVIFASIIFAIAHIRFSFNPFSLSYSTFQVVYAMVLGYFYGICYEQSKSVIYPMIMHSYSNVLMVGLTIILSIIL